MRGRACTLMQEGSGNGPLSGFFRGMASALEGALNTAWPGRLELLDQAETALRESERAAELLGRDVTIGQVSAMDSYESESGSMQLQCEASGSAGKGVLSIRGDSDGEGGPMELELLYLRVGEEFVEIVS